MAETGDNENIEEMEDNVSAENILDDQPDELVRKRNSTSVIWDYFGVKKNDNSVIVCKTCRNPVSAKGGNTSNLFHHLRDKHPQHHAEVTKAKINKKPASQQQTSEAKSQPDILSAFDKAKPFNPNSNQAQTINNAIAFYICKDMQPLYSIERTGFVTMMKKIEPRYKIPSRRYMKEKVIDKMAADLNETVVTKLKGADYFAFTTDMWTSRNMEAYMSLTIHFITSEWELEAINLGAFPMMDDHTGDNIATALTSVLDDWGLDTCKVVAATTDSASNNIKAFNTLKILRLSCFGHNLDLAVNKGTELPECQRAIKVCKKAIEAFSRSFKRRRDLKKKQKKLDILIHMLIMDVSTRWGSTIDMIDRFIEQQQAVCAVFMENRQLWHLNPSDNDYRSLENINETLKPLLLFTDMFSGEEYVTVSAILPVLEHILSLLEPLPAECAMRKNIRAAVHRNLKQRYENTEHRQILMLCCMLDPRFKSAPFDGHNCVVEIDANDLEQVKSKILEEAQILSVALSGNKTVENQAISDVGAVASTSSSTVINCPPTKKIGLSGIIKNIKQKYRSAGTIISLEEKVQKRT